MPFRSSILIGFPVLDKSPLQSVKMAAERNEQAKEVRNQIAEVLLIK